MTTELADGTTVEVAMKPIDMDEARVLFELGQPVWYRDPETVRKGEHKWFLVFPKHTSPGDGDNDSALKWAVRDGS